MADQVTFGPSGKPVTAVRFSYAKNYGDQFELYAYVSEMTTDGAKLELRKRMGPSNYTGHLKSDNLILSGEQVKDLIEILARYDLEAWSKLPFGSYSSGPTRSLMVYSGEKFLYDIMWSARFPKTLPPQEDIMYAELFNYFNAIVAKEPGWEEVKGPDLEDPRDNPAYKVRKIIWFGKERKLVPGTGTAHTDGSYADIDYEGDSWWVEEGFVGRWVPVESEVANPFSPLNTPDPERMDSELIVRPDGSVSFRYRGEDWPGRVDKTRRVEKRVGFSIWKEYDGRGCEVTYSEEDSYQHIHVSCFPGPVPSPQFTPMSINLVKVE